MHDRHTEGNNTGIALLRKLTKGKTVAGIIFEVCWHVKVRGTDGRMCEGGERLTKRRKVQFRHFLIELLRQGVGISLAGRGFSQISHQIMLHRHLVREGKQ